MVEIFHRITPRTLLILACYIQHQKSIECKFSIHIVICVTFLSTRVCHRNKTFQQKNAHQQTDKHMSLWVERFYVTAGRHRVSIMYFDTCGYHVYDLLRPSKLAQAVMVLSLTVPGAVQLQS
jgi:hypothetical protein